MSEQRTVLVGNISYRGTDGEDHVAVKGDKVTVAAEGLAHFDFLHAGTPEQHAADDAKRNAENEKAAKAKLAPEGKKA